MSTIEDVLPDIALRFNIEHPSYEECYAYGYACAVASLDLEVNPYASGTKLAGQWEEGWWDGFYGHDPLFTLDWLNAPVAANDQVYSSSTLLTLLKITGTLAASVFVGYQLFEWVA
ncbi:MAG: hypothetical protein A3F18_01090 [Legionellales bacterium RIFCSPHIGHO2_12_FULL_37_14]|nr:MAG: hypothetical protein A3F18_01090 [Legionellales bacterium RIFCSPHIGHO2_12_FULL_37_14]